MNITRSDHDIVFNTKQTKKYKKVLNHKPITEIKFVRSKMES